MLLDRLRQMTASGELRPDPAQEAAAGRLERLAGELADYRSAAPREAGNGGGGLLGWLGLGREEPRAVPAAPRGVYVHGDVGRGKSMLMDLFFDTVAFAPKRRVHFHEFMLDVQARLHAMRGEEGEGNGNGDPLRRLAGRLAAEHRLLCFDEFHVASIADAMILGRLFAGLFEEGVVVVATSNWPPERLYEDGLNRDRFLPFIDLLLERVDVVALEGPTDYRLQRLRDLPAYLTPPGPEADARLAEVMRVLGDGTEPAPAEVPVGGRTLPVPAATGGVAAFAFPELCGRALGAADYLALTERFHTVVLRGVPVFTPDKRNEARRFMTLVDALYERRAMLFLSAATPPEGLYAAGDGAFEFRRTVSRLHEMQSRDYLDACRRRRLDQLPTGFTPYALTSDLL